MSATTFISHRLFVAALGHQGHDGRKRERPDPWIEVEANHVTQGGTPGTGRAVLPPPSTVLRQPLASSLSVGC